MPLRLRTLLEDGRRQLLAMNLRKVHAALFKNAPFAHYTGAATAALGAIPAFLLEAAHTIEGLQTCTNLVLEPHHQSTSPFPGISWWRGHWCCSAITGRCTGGGGGRTLQAPQQ